MFHTSIPSRRMNCSGVQRTVGSVPAAMNLQNTTGTFSERRATVLSRSRWSMRLFPNAVVEAIMATSRTAFVCCVFIMIASPIAVCAAGSGDDTSDPLQHITSSFPKTIELKNKGKLLEFCPDNTCDGFVAAPPVSVGELKDFAYLYIYFFSDYYVLQDWRNQQEARKAAEAVLSKPEYRGCRGENGREAARCVLLDLSRDGRIKLIFIRYDENQRNVVHRDIAKELSGSKAAPK
jgi:hypothetical protein